MDQIRAHQVEDDNLRAIWYKVLRGEAKSVTFDPEGILRICGRICVPGVGGWVRMILEDAHCSKYSIHPRATKMCHDLKQHYWWCGMKKDIVDFVFKCLNCQQVKYEHQIPGEQFSRIYIREFVRLHGLPISIVPDRGAQFTSHFWSHMEDHKGTKLDKGAHPSANGAGIHLHEPLIDAIKVKGVVTVSASNNLPIREAILQNQENN
ncbi:uncharacterized protein LOC125823483 [Solanum verrucosum]|uniref:uncharacterized protein LOC125823483 n=1 Tax=Solanum verrucosum TaxID=315347 RepID=UPI0020D0E816|nr:uncharacterized protein LOC125823483 [Solanum verrucosum]